MSEQAPNPHQSESEHQQLVVAAHEQAVAEGFDLQQAIRKNHGADISEEQIQQRAERVINTAAAIADDLELDASFFDRSANTVLLFSVADSWRGTDDKISKATEHNTKIADERAMLVDTMLMVAGKTSGFARSLAESNQSEADRYIPKAEYDEEDAKRLAFFESVEDKQLAAQVEAVLNSESGNSILQAQREMLGVTSENEQKFSVKVLKMGSRWDLQNAGLFPKVEWPNYDVDPISQEARQARLEHGKRAQEQSDAQVAAAAEYEAASATYVAQFGEKHGKLAEAFVNHNDVTGEVTMYLRAPEAISLVQYATQSFEGELTDTARDLALSTVRHEYAHTQKELFMGAHSQLGLILEERKAEFVSHDKLGYQDIKYFITDLSMINDRRILDGLGEALKQPDALSAFLVWSSNNLGLRNTLMLMASKPAPYDADPHYAAKFPDTKAIRHSHDESAHDAVVRENLDAKGDEQLRTSVASWAGNLVVDRGVEFTERISNGFVFQRERHGLKKTAPYIQEALDKVVAAHQEDATGDAT